MPVDGGNDKAKTDNDVSPEEGAPAKDDVHARLARHGFLISDDVDDPEGANVLAATMLSVIESMLTTGKAGEEPAAEAKGDDTAGPPPSKASPSS